MAGSMVYRLRATTAGTPHIKLYNTAMTAAQAITDNRGYNYIAGFHGAPGWYCWHHQRNPKTTLQARLFLPWHRAYLYWLEQALQDRQAGTAIPWWDWTRDRRLPASFTAAKIGGQPSALRSSRARVTAGTPKIDQVTVRQPGANPAAQLPTKPNIDALLAEGDFATFSDQLEDLHDHVHVWVGGDMQDQTTAAYDPIFFSHHCMIDRVWALWQTRHGNGGVPQPLLDLELVPFGLRVQDVLTTQALGYEYAASATEVHP